MIRVSRIDSHDGLWVHENVLDVSTFNALKSLSDFLISDQRHTMNEETRELIGSTGEPMRLIAFSTERNYSKLWHLPGHKEYWFQTNETIFSWVEQELKKIHPALRMMLSRFRNFAPFDDGDEWIPYRGIFNHLKPGVALEPHIDGSGGFEVDDNKHSIYSSTIYFTIPEEGGMFWDELGFIIKPKINMLLINKSNRIRHGVTAGNETRLGFTVRWAKAKELILPGHPDKLLWKPAST